MALSGSLNFISASEFGSVYVPDLGGRYFGAVIRSDGTAYIPDDPSRSTSEPIRTDFVGLNTNIYEPVTSSTNTLGYPGLSQNDGGGSAAIQDVNYINQTFVAGVASTFDETYLPTGLATTLNSVLLHRNGPYQHPSWKQYRGGEHPVARHLRLNNTMSIDAADPDPILKMDRQLYERYTNERDQVFELRNERAGGASWRVERGSIVKTPPSLGIENYYEPAVTKNHKPFIYDVDVNGIFGSEKARVRSTLGNQAEYFANEKLNARLKIETGLTARTGSQEGFRNRAQAQIDLVKAARSLGAHNFVYSKTVFPKNINTWRNFTLDRPNYEEESGLGSNGYDRANNRSFWRDRQENLALRIGSSGSARIRTQGVAENSQGIKQNLYHVYENWASGTNDVQWYVNVGLGYPRGQRFGGPDENYPSGTVPSLITNYRYLWHYGGPGPRKADDFTGDSDDPNPIETRPWTNRSCFTASGVGQYGGDGGFGSTSGSAFGGAGPRWAGSFKPKYTYASDYPSISDLDANIDNGSPAFTWIQGGIIASQAINTLTSSNDGTNVGADGLPGTGDPVFVQHETYNPYPITALSMWPLDPRPDIYDKPEYLTSSIGGKGLQIGLTPHRMMEYFVDQYPGGLPTGSSGANLSSSGGAFPEYTGYETLPLTATLNPCFTGSHKSVIDYTNPTSGSILHFATASYLQLAYIQTGSAGELAYSTKPTIFFFNSGSARAQDNRPVGGTDADLFYSIGYRTQTASLQYNRHTFPYNTPFYATNKIRQRNPFFNSYSDFKKDLNIVARDYSVLPEYRISENLQYYFEKYFKGMNNIDLFVESGEHKDTPQHNAQRKILRAANPNSIDNAINRFKLDFLRLEGANVTSSALNSALTGSKPEDISSYYEYDATTQTSVATGADLKTIHYSADSQAPIFYEKFSHTDDIADFSNFFFGDDVNTVPSRIKFNIQGIKKLLPYKNFYPVTKTVDIGNKFKKFIYEILQPNPSLGVGGREGRFYHAGRGANPRVYDRTPGDLQAFLEPFFAPGILYNSLKSGIAVDYPIYYQDVAKQTINATAPVYFTPLTFMSGGMVENTGLKSHMPFNFDQPVTESVHTGAFYTRNSRFRFSNKITCSFPYGGFYSMGASRQIPAILNRAPSHRLSFEALYDTSKLDMFHFDKGAVYLTTDFVDLDLNTPSAEATGTMPAGQTAHHPGAAFIEAAPRALLKKKPTQMPYNTNKNLYEFSINNFLCETMNFFLEDQEKLPGVKLPVASSLRRSSSDFSFNKSKTYFMEVSLRMGVDHVSCEGPRNAGVGGGSLIDNLYANDQLNASMRGYIYGPPIEAVQMSGTTTVTSFPDVLDSTTGEFISKTEPYIASYRDGGIHVGSPYTGENGGLATNPGRSFLYGPSPTGYVYGAGGTGSVGYYDPADYESYFAANLQDPAYQAFTPPYFYGDSSAILAFTPADSSPNMNTVYSTVKYQSFYFDQYVTGNASPGVRDNHSLCVYVPGTSSISQGSRTRMPIDASLEVFMDSNASPVTVYTTKGNSTETEHVWYVAPRWICPVLDFSSSLTTIEEYYTDQGAGQRERKTYTIVTNSFHDVTTGRGLWGGYGTDPYDPEAIAMCSRDVPFFKDLNNVSIANELDKGVFMTVKYPFHDKQFEEQDVVFKTDMFNKQGYYTHISNPGDVEALRDLALDRGEDPLTIAPGTSDASGSLASALGFEEKEYPIGKVSSNGKTISEAIVIIPYFEKPVHIPIGGKQSDIVGASSGLGSSKLWKEFEIPGKEIFTTREIIPGKHFLPIHETLFENLLSMNLAERKFSAQTLLKQENPYVGFSSGEELLAAKQTDVYKMIDMLLDDDKNNRPGYEIPPEFDFIHYDILPFQMIVIPVQHTLKKQELIDIYQGIMPDSSLKMEQVRASEEFIPNKAMTLGESPTWMPRIKRAEELGGDVSLEKISPHNFLSSQAINEYNTDQLSGFMNAEKPLPSWLKNSKDFYKNLKFMTFKVKQRAKKNYATYRDEQIARSIKNHVLKDAEPGAVTFDTRFESVLGYRKKVKDHFGYNWPYDDFSLLEAVKIDIELGID